MLDKWQCDKCSLFFVFHDLIDDDEDKLIITVEVKRHNMSIEWNETLSDKNGKAFKEMSLAVKTQLNKDLKELSVSQIKVKSFILKEGNTFCEFECRVNSKAVTKEDIEKVLNMTVDIGAAEGKSYTRVTMSLNLLSLSWIDAYDDPNTPEYENLKTEIIDALSEVFQNTDNVAGFEIVSVSKALDGSLAVEYVALVDPDADVKQNDLEETFKKFTKDRSFEKMITGVEKRQLQQSQDQKDEPPVGVIVFAALILCAVIIAFVVVVSAFLYTANEDYLIHRAVFRVKLTSSNNEVHWFGEFETAFQVCITVREFSLPPSVFMRLCKRRKSTLLLLNKHKIRANLKRPNRVYVVSS